MIRTFARYRFNLYEGDACEVRKKFETVFQVIFKPILDNPPKVDGMIFTDLMKIASHLIPGANRDAIIELVRRKYKLPERPLTTTKSKVFVWTMIFIQDKILKTWWISAIVRPILNYLSKIGVVNLQKIIELLAHKA